MHEVSGKRSTGLQFWTALNRSPALTFASLVAFYALIVCAQASTRLLWGDELITLDIARTGSFAAIYHALQLGADPNPPLIHFAALLSTRLFGQHALAVRLPSVAGMLLALCGTWILLRRWVAPGFCAIGVLAFMATRALDYGYEARSYAPLAGFTMAALVCWTWAADQADCRTDVVSSKEMRQHRSAVRGAALFGTALCLALAVSSNYYGVMAWSPIVAGEVVFSIRCRKVYPATWLCLAVAAVPLLAYVPLIRHNIAEFTPHAWNHPRVSMVTESYLILVEGVFWPVVMGGVVLWWRSRRARALNRTGESLPSHALELHEVAALAVLLAYPVLGFGLAVAEAAMISPRCVIPVCCAFGIAAGVLASRLANSARAAVVLLAGLVVWVAAREAACAVLLQQQRTSFVKLIGAIESAPPGTILISDSALVLPLAHYGDERLRSRLVFPIDFAAIHAWEPDDSGEQNLWAGRVGVFPFAIVPYSAAIVTPSPSLVIARSDGWLVRKLTADGLTLKGITTTDQSKQLRSLGGVFTPMDHEETRLLAPAQK